MGDSGVQGKSCTWRLSSLCCCDEIVLLFVYDNQRSFIMRSSLYTAQMQLWSVFAQPVVLFAAVKCECLSCPLSCHTPYPCDVRFFPVWTELDGAFCFLDQHVNKKARCVQSNAVYSPTLCTVQRCV